MDKKRIGILESPEYDKVFDNCYGEIMLLGYGGSYAYGTNIKTSDVDIRGFYQNPMSELLGITPDKEQFVDGTTDTTIYSLKKMVRLLSDCNPNCIEILGLRPEDYFYVSDEAKMILDKKEIFLSKKAVNTFGGYANSQLNRLVNKSGRASDELVRNELRSMSKSILHIQEKYHQEGDMIGVKENDNALLLDLDFRNMPIEDVRNILEELNQVHMCYAKSTRNDKAIARGKIAKHMMHLIRLYMMAIDILERQEIVTYRSAEHDLLMDIRNGKFLEEDGVTPTKGFEELLDEYTRRFDEAKTKTALPDKPRYDEINTLVMDINRLYLGKISGRPMKRKYIMI